MHIKIILLLFFLLIENHVVLTYHFILSLIPKLYQFYRSSNHQYIMLKFIKKICILHTFLFLNYWFYYKLFKSKMCITYKCINKLIIITTIIYTLTNNFQSVNTLNCFKYFFLVYLNTNFWTF